MKLYELAEAYRNLQELLEDDNTDITAIQDTLEAIEEEINAKCENIAKLIRTLEAQEKLLKEEEERLARRRKTLESKREWLKKYTMQQLEAAGIDKIRGALFTITLQMNPPAVEIVDEEIFMRACEGTKYLIPQPPKINKKAILEDIKAGFEVPGVVLRQEKGLRIR